MFNQLRTLRVKLLRYSGVSAVAVVVTQSCLWFGLVVTNWPAVVANVVAVSLGAIPAYLLNRSWCGGGRILTQYVMKYCRFGSTTWLG